MGRSASPRGAYAHLGASEPASAAGREPRTYEALLEAARANAAGEQEGLFGPASLTWRVQRELALVLGGGRAVLLQIAHPAVAAGVDQHSDYAHDPLGRTRRTFETVYRIAFADLSTALGTARRLHDLHATVRGRSEARPPSPGRPYHALDPRLLFWVFATLFDTSVLCYEALFARLSPEDRARFYAEMRLGALVYGIPARFVPPSFEDFQAYMAEMLEGPTLEVGPAALRIYEALLRQRPSELLVGLVGARESRLLSSILDNRPVSGHILDEGLLLTASLLPPRLRHAFGLPWKSGDDRRARRLLGWLRTVIPRLPPALRFAPEYRAAMTRLAPSRRRLFLGWPRHPARLGASLPAR